MKKGFTLLELMVVIIIIGVLATLGVVQYQNVVERGRTAEARQILGQMRNAQTVWRLDHTTYATMAQLNLGLPTAGPACTDTKFWYYFATDSGTGTSTANRCTSSGKTPAGTACDLTLSIDGVWGGATPCPQ